MFTTSCSEDDRQKKVEGQRCCRTKVSVSEKVGKVLVDQAAWRRGPARLGLCAQWPDPTIGAGSPRHMRSDLMKGDVHRPAIDNPCQDLDGLHAWIGHSKACDSHLPAGSRTSIQRSARGETSDCYHRARPVAMSTSRLIPPYQATIPFCQTVAGSVSRACNVGCAFLFRAGRPFLLVVLSAGGSYKAGIQTHACDRSQKFQDSRGSVTHDHQAPLR